MVIGPALGGYLSSTLGKRAPAIGAAGLSLLSMASLLFLDNTAGQDADKQSDKKKTKPGNKKEEEESQSLGGRLLGLFTLLGSNPGARSIMLLRVALLPAAMAMRSLLPLLLKEAYGWQEKEVGLTMSFVGIVGVASQAVLVPFAVGLTRAPVRVAGADEEDGEEEEEAAGNGARKASEAGARPRRGNRANISPVTRSNPAGGSKPKGSPAVSETHLVLGCIAGIAAAFGAFAWSSALDRWASMAGVLLALTAMTVCTSLIQTITTAELASTVGPGQQGTINSLDMTVGSLIRMVAPPAGTQLIKAQGATGLGVAGAGLMGVAAVLLQSGAAAAVAPEPAEGDEDDQDQRKSQ